MNTKPTPDWIAVDWGTSNLRAWSMQGSAMLEAACSADGMGTLNRDGFATALSKLITPLSLPQGRPVIACGMVGSRQGWVEAPYRSLPCTPLAASFARADTGGNPVHIIAGLRQDKPADVMRGEETQIAGFLALNKGWDGVICLPGTHTKWVEVSAGEVISFQTFMTGEMFALLGKHSVLRHSVESPDWDQAAFDTGVDDIFARPERLAAQLFSIRASDLLNGTPAPAARARLSGLLIGAELAAARPYWLGRQVAVLGADGQANHYRTALETQGVPAMIVNAERMTLAGLTAAYTLWKDTQ